MRKNKFDNKERRGKILAEMAVGHDWEQALRNVAGVSDSHYPANGVAVAIQQVDDLSIIPNLLYAQATEECQETVAHDLSATDPPIEVAFAAIREATIWTADDGR